MVYLVDVETNPLGGLPQHPVMHEEASYATTCQSWSSSSAYLRVMRPLLPQPIIANLFFIDFNGWWNHPEGTSS